MTEHPPWNDPKYTEDEARKFWEDARAKAGKADCNFEWVYFPEDPAGVYFTEVQFGGDANFRRAKFGGDANFRRAKFGGKASFGYAKFGGKADFLGAEFGGDANFGGAEFGGEAWFLYGEFGWNAYFQRAKFGKNANFHEAEFGRDADFFDAKFGGDAIFPKAEFARDVDFWGAEFGGDADFLHAKFGGDVDFSRAEFRAKARMTDAIFGGRLTVDLPSGFWRARGPFRRSAGGVEVYRVAKQSAADRGDYRLAAEYRYVEQSMTNNGELFSSIKWLWGRIPLPRRPVVFVLAVLEFLFGRLIFGYGERVRGVLVAAAVVMLGWSVRYCSTGIQTGVTEEGSPILTSGFWDCLYFSVVTFTTLGYGDFRPTEELRVWAAGEALIGAFLMALFVVAMARKFTR